MTSKTTTDNFELTYGGKGGVATLKVFYEAGVSTSEIAEHFELTTKQVNYYLKNIIGENYLRYPWRKVAADLRHLKS